MRAVKVCLPGEGFAAAIITVREWLERNRCEPTGYRYQQNEDTVIVSVVFDDSAQAEAFARQFDGRSSITTPGPFETALA